MVHLKKCFRVIKFVPPKLCSVNDSSELLQCSLHFLCNFHGRLLLKQLIRRHEMLLWSCHTSPPSPKIFMYCPSSMNQRKIKFLKECHLLTDLGFDRITPSRILAVFLFPFVKGHFGRISPVSKVHDHDHDQDGEI
ncbi:hypothetical protein SCA6_003352 [Theobroma cacao]